MDENTLRKKEYRQFFLNIDFEYFNSAKWNVKVYHSLVVRVLDLQIGIEGSNPGGGKFFPQSNLVNFVFYDCK